MRTARSSSRPRGWFPPGTPPSRDQAPPGPGTLPGQDPPCGQTDTCKHITLPQNSFAGGKNVQSVEH